MTKNYRQGQILKIIRSKPIYTQDELAQELKNEQIFATQVTLSRDLRDLHLIKTPEGYREIGDGEAGQQLSNLVANFLRDARVAQNLVVLKTDPGHASVIAVAMDDEDWPEVVGTLAGDDTILVISSDHATAEKLRERLLQLLA